MREVLAMLAMLVGLAACAAGSGVGDGDQTHIYVVNNSWQSALAQASIGYIAATSPAAP